jgi:hypothetical protein
MSCEANPSNQMQDLVRDVPRPMPLSGREYAERISVTNFINAYYQVRDALCYSPRTVLVVGVGVGLEPVLLHNRFAMDVTTYDIDPGFGADHVGSVHEMTMFNAGQFDLCIVSHVLEHLPFRYFEPALLEIARVARHALIYLPFGLRFFEFKFVRAQREKEYGLSFTVPRWRKIDGTKPELCGGAHYWEVGYRNFETWRLRETISKYFIVDSIYHNRDWTYSMNFRVTARQHLQNP